MKQSNLVKYNTEISVIIANRNTGIFLPRLLKSLLAEKGRYEIIIIDDASTDNSVEVISRFARKSDLIKLITLKEHGGAAQARNIGAEASCGRFLLFLDSDTKVKPGWSAVIPGFFRRNQNTGIGIAKILKIDSSKFDSAGELTSPFCFLVERARGAVDTGQFDREDRIFSGKSAAMVIRRDVFEKIYGFDESYVIFLEDTDLCWRAQLSGFEVRFCPQVTVWHDFYSGLKSQDYYNENRAYFHGSRNTLMTIFKNLSILRIIYIFPVQILTWQMLGTIQLINGRQYQGLEIFKGIYSTINQIPGLIRKRADIQKSRSVRDGRILDPVMIRPNLSYYLGKTNAYSLGKAY